MTKDEMMEFLVLKASEQEDATNTLESVENKSEVILEMIEISKKWKENYIEIIDWINGAFNPEDGSKGT